MKKAKEFIKKPKVIIAIAVAFLSVAIIALLYSIYVNDEPAFIPEETKETVRGAIKEGIAEPIKLISKPLGEKISNAAWTKDKKENDGNSYGHTEEGNGKKDTKNWPTYTDPEMGISIKYPEGWVAIDDSFTGTFFIESYKVEELDQLKVDYVETDFPYWGGMGIGLEKVDTTRLSVDEYIDSYFGTEGVTKSSTYIGQYPAIRVVDSGPDRFGGGIGYYYYVTVGNNNLCFSLDYFLDQEVSQEMITYLELVSKSIEQ